MTDKCVRSYLASIKVAKDVYALFVVDGLKLAFQKNAMNEASNIAYKWLGLKTCRCLTSVSRGF